MTALATIACVGASLAALAALAATDPKRRRAFRMPALKAGPDRRLLWTAALAPGVVAPLLGGGAGFVLWFGATTVAGWSLAALSPERTERLARRLSAAQGRLAARSFRGRVARRFGDEPALARRVAALEAEVATLRLRLGAEDPAARRGEAETPVAIEPTPIRASRLA